MRRCAIFARKLKIEYVDSSRSEGILPTLCPTAWIDNFAMRNFTNHAIFDDTLPRSDGLLEAGFRVPLQELQVAMEDWFRRKGYIKSHQSVVITELSHLDS